MSRASAASALLAPPLPIPGLVASTRRPSWPGLEAILTRASGAIGDCARIAWWDGSAVGLHLNSLLGLFEADTLSHRKDRA